MITGKLGLLLVATGSKQGPTSPPATSTRTSAEPTAFGAAGEPSDAQRQIEHARNLAKCLSALQGLDSTTEAVSSRTGEIRDAKEAARELIIASGMGDFLLSPGELLQECAIQIACAVRHHDLKSDWHLEVQRGKCAA